MLRIRVVRRFSPLIGGASGLYSTFVPPSEPIPVPDAPVGVELADGTLLAATTDADGIAEIPDVVEASAITALDDRTLATRLEVRATEEPIEIAMPRDIPRPSAPMPAGYVALSGALAGLGVREPIVVGPGMVRTAEPRVDFCVPEGGTAQLAEPPPAATYAGYVRAGARVSLLALDLDWETGRFGSDALVYGASRFEIGPLVDDTSLDLDLLAGRAEPERADVTVPRDIGTTPNVAIVTTRGCSGWLTGAHPSEGSTTLTFQYFRVVDEALVYQRYSLGAGHVLVPGYPVNGAMLDDLPEPPVLSAPAIPGSLGPATVVTWTSTNAPLTHVLLQGAGQWIVQVPEGATSFAWPAAPPGIDVTATVGTTESESTPAGSAVLTHISCRLGSGELARSCVRLTRTRAEGLTAIDF